MALSAYSSEGNLKKNPLLGTSLAVDPRRKAMRQGFLDLYGEAKKSAGEGRGGMLRRLSERNAALGAANQADLERIPKQLQQLQDEASSYVDEDKLKDLTERAATAEKWMEDQNKAQSARGYKGAHIKSEYDKEIQDAWKNLDWADQRKRQSYGDYNRFKEVYLEDMVNQLSNYRNSVNSRVASLNKLQYLPLLEQQKLVTKTLNDRADLYNAFLGGD